MRFTVVVLEASKSNGPIPRGPSPGKRAHVPKKESGGDGGTGWGGILYQKLSRAILDFINFISANSFSNF